MHVGIIEAQDAMPNPYLLCNGLYLKVSLDEIIVKLPEAIESRGMEHVEYGRGFAMAIFSRKCEYVSMSVYEFGGPVREQASLKQPIQSKRKQLVKSNCDTTEPQANTAVCPPSTRLFGTLVGLSLAQGALHSGWHRRFPTLWSPASRHAHQSALEGKQKHTGLFWRNLGNRPALYKHSSERRD